MRKKQSVFIYIHLSTEVTVLEMKAGIQKSIPLVIKTTVVFLTTLQGG